MTIIAKFASFCPVCGQRIKVGEKVEWSKGQKACHLNCVGKPASISTRTSTPKVPASTEPAPFRLGGGSGYGCQGWDVGQTVRCGDRLREQGYPEYITVVRAKKYYVREDGLSVGVGDESGYSYSAECRAATDAEAAPVRERLEKAAARKSAQKRVEEIGRTIQTTGEHVLSPDGQQIRLDGERLYDSQTIYGGGSWFVITSDGLWYCRNNGADGDDWSRSNVATGGAGAIGWRLVEGADALTAELRALATISK
jgi:hypothetical protein